ncbi:MAG: TolB family protein [Acidobacteriota bacterium]
MSALGGSARKVIPEARSRSVESPPQWSGDGDELAGVVVDSTGVSVEIVSMSTRESRRLSLSGYRPARMDLSWSPDERFFAVVDVAYGLVSDVGQLWVLRLSDGEAFQVTDGLTKVWSPSWSSDGRSLYFVSNRGGGMDLWEQPLGPDGKPEGNPRAVTVGVGMRHAAFSPDGTQLAYSRGRVVANV